MWVMADRMTFRYQQDLIFQEMSFALSDNLVALQGPSGSGKTTLLKLIRGDLQPASGSIGYTGSSAILILQDDSLIPWLTGKDNLHVSLSFTEDRIHDQRILSSMSAFLHKRAYQMSFGQRRYVEIVRALGSDADILLFDEPLNFLDADRRATVMQELVHQSKTRRVIMSTHYIEDFAGAPISRVQLRGVAPFRELAVP